jgi:hypothetical protein
MEKTTILCPHCGQRLAQLWGAVGHRRRLKPLGGAEVRTSKNALGEELGWIRCPRCKADKTIDPAHWLGNE